MFWILEQGVALADAVTAFFKSTFLALLDIADFLGVTGIAPILGRDRGQHQMVATPPTAA